MKALLLLLVTICSCADFIINSGSDSQFEVFLDTVMTNYNEWLRNNTEDPSTPIKDTLLLSRDWIRVNITCNISNQRMIDSLTKDDVVSSESNFAQHYFVVSREIHTPYQFQGDVTCSGVIRASGFEDVDQDTPFVGTGNWTITANYSDEFMEVFNVGVTSDGKFDLTHSWINYFFNPIFAPSIQFDVTWEDIPGGEEIVKHKDKVSSYFKSLYYDFLLYDSYPSDLHPSYRLLRSYIIDDVINKTLISEIITSDPPPSYAPTPSPRTTTSTTTPRTTTSTPSSTSTTTGKDDGNTTPPSSGTSVIINYGLVYLSLVTALLTKR